MTLKTMTAIALAGIMAAGMAAPVIAENLTGTDAIAKRQELMKNNGRMLRSAKSATGDAAIAAAQSLVDDFEMLPTLFPEDSMTGNDTQALPSIWEDPAGFKARMTAAQDAANALLAAAQGADQAAYGASFQQMAKACGDCHMTYRQKL